MLLLSTAALENHDNFSQSLKKDSSLLANTILAWASTNLPLAKLKEKINLGSSVLAKLESNLIKSNLQIPGYLDWQLLKLSTTSKKVFEHVLLWGFDSTHWPLLPLLQAIILHSQNTQLLALTGWTESTPAEALWQSTWEAFAKKYHTTWQDHSGDKPPSKDPPTINLAVDDRNQSQLITQKTIHTLSRDPDTEILIALPGRGIIHSEITHLLQQLEIPALDLISTPEVDPTHQTITAWANLQQDWETPALIQLLLTCKSLSASHGYSSSEQLIKKISILSAELLTTDLCIIQKALQSENPAFIPFIKLPEKISLSDFQQHLEKFLRKSSQKLITSPTTDVFSEIAALKDDIFPTAALLQAILQSTRPSSRKDIPLLREFFAPVTIAPNDIAPWLSKTHLILAGQNDHHWPPRHRSKTWLDKSTIHDINHSFTIPSPHGLGELCISPDHALLLSPDISEQIAIRNTQLAAYTTSNSPAIFASALDIANNRPAQPSPILTDILTENQTSWENLTPSPEHSLSLTPFHSPDESSTKPSNELVSHQKINHSITAYRQRHDPDTPFGKFDFSFTEHAPHPRAISAKKLAASAQQPAHLWFTTILGTEPHPDIDELTPLPLFIGNKLHALLKNPFPPNSHNTSTSPQAGILPTIQNRLHELEKKLTTLIHSAFAEPAPLPHLLQFALRQLTQKTLAIAERLQPLLEHHTLRCEVPFHDITTPDGLRLSARIDAMLTPTSGTSDTIILDYKSGDAQSSPPSSDYLQLYLYTQILAAQGITAQARTLTAHGNDARVSQQTLPKKISSLYTTLHTLCTHACFPLLAPTQHKHSHTPELPLAILDIPTSTLSKKLSHWLPQDNTATSIFAEDSSENSEP
jgi:hypothetical protein